MQSYLYEDSFVLFLVKSLKSLLYNQHVHGLLFASYRSRGYRICKGTPASFVSIHVHYNIMSNEEQNSGRMNLLLKALVVCVWERVIFLVLFEKADYSEIVHALARDFKSIS